MKLKFAFARRATALVCAAAVAIALTACAGREKAPEVRYTLLDGTPGSTAALRGKVVLVYLWATSCTTCVHEMPQLVSTYRKYRARGFETLAVAMSYDPPNYVANFVETRQLPFPVALDVDGAHARAFGNVQLTPTSFIIGKDGQILEQKLGELDFARLRALLDRELS
jgi:peroxiredoxin